MLTNDPQKTSQMQVIRKWIRFFFGFSRRETNGFLILLPLMVMAIFSQPLFRMVTRPEVPDFSREVAVLDSLEGILVRADSAVGAGEGPVAQAFQFDPNTATEMELVSLGFPDWLSARIVRYRDKGGRFKRKSDLLKIYGMDSASYLRLYPFIDLPEAKVVSPQAQDKLLTVHSADTAFDLNEADTASLKKIRGIGSVLAQRIVRYRQSLGGFVRKEQLYEVYRLDSPAAEALSRASFIREDFIPRPIGVNSLDEYELSRHPYIGNRLAEAIVAFRFQHGPFGSIEDIQGIQLVDDSLFVRITPYLGID